MCDDYDDVVLLHPSFESGPSTHKAKLKNSFGRPFAVYRLLASKRVKRLQQSSPRPIFMSPSSLMTQQRVLQQQHLENLAHQHCLVNDDIINYYLKNVLQANCTTRHRDRPLKTLAFSSYFYPIYMKSGYKGVYRIARDMDLLSYELLLFPIFEGLGGNAIGHWTICAVHLHGRWIAHFDSLQNHSSSQTVCNNIYCYLQEQAYHRQIERHRTRFVNPFREFTYYDASEEEQYPTQQNGTDCGVFLLQYAKCLVQEAPFNFSQRDIGSIRKELAKEVHSVQSHHEEDVIVLDD